MSHTPLKRAALVGVLVAFLDQLSKWWLVNYLMVPPHTIAVTPFLNLVMVHNHGITFGLMNRMDHRVMPVILIAVAIVILFFLGRWLWLTRSIPVALGLGAIMGGAVGNLLDRIREGAVVDFIDFYYQNYHWYAFNVADAAICVGVSLLLLDSLIRAR